MSKQIESREPDKAAAKTAEAWQREAPIVGARRTVEIGQDGAVTRIEHDHGGRTKYRAPHPESAEHHARVLEDEIKRAAIDRDIGSEGPRAPELTSEDAKEFLKREPRRDIVI